MCCLKHAVYLKQGTTEHIGMTFLFFVGIIIYHRKLFMCSLVICFYNTKDYSNVISINQGNLRLVSFPK